MENGSKLFLSNFFESENDLEFIAKSDIYRKIFRVVLMTFELNFNFSGFLQVEKFYYSEKFLKILIFILEKFSIFLSKIASRPKFKIF